VVDDIQRMVDIDYLVVMTDEALVEAGMSKSFLLPYIDRYILTANIEEKKIYTKDAKDILEAS
jgi:16S rRNA processing protein RimM